VIRSIPLAFLALCACAAGPRERPLTVREVVENAQTLDGEVVVVSGWIERCHRISCGIFESADEVDRDFPYYLSIGSSRWFDAFAQRAGPTHVVLRARLRSRCISDPATRIIAACADRPGTLEPIALIR
jgi:hypothetical protein